MKINKPLNGNGNFYGNDRNEKKLNIMQGSGFIKLKIPKDMRKIASKDNISKKLNKFLIDNKKGSNISRLKTIDTSPSPNTKNTSGIRKSSTFKNIKEPASLRFSTNQRYSDMDFKIDLKSIIYFF